MSAVQQRLQQDHPKPFLTAMSGAVTQVSVVTTNGTAGRFGVTVSAFTSVSADPPLVLVCINRRSPVVKAIEENGCFCVNLLDDRQSTVADCFSGRSDPLTAYDFSCANWRLEATGSPCLDQANANFDCTIENAYDAGTHRIFIGEVQDAQTSGRAPLAFSRRSYQALSPLNLE